MVLLGVGDRAITQKAPSVITKPLNKIQQFERTLTLIVYTLLQKWSGRRDSNPRRQPWEGCILPLNYFRNMSEFTTNKFYLQYIIYSASCFFMLSPKSSKEPRVTTSSPALTPEITSVY